MSKWLEPVVYATDWKCGNILLPPKTIACPAEDSGTTGSGDIAKKTKFFKRSNTDDEQAEETPNAACAKYIKDKRDEEPASNVIKPIQGRQSVARVSAAMNHEIFYDTASKSGLFALGAQHGVGLLLFSMSKHIIDGYLGSRDYWRVGSGCRT
jgi:hypothetical protein